MIKTIAGIFQSGQTQPKTLRLGQGIVEVFKLQCAQPPGGKIHMCHARTVQLQDCAVCKPAFQRRTHGGGVSASFLQHQHRFSHRRNGDTDDGLIGQFCQLPSANRANMHRSPHCAERGRNAVKILWRAARHNCQTGLLGAFGAPRYRRIHIGHTKSLQIFCCGPSLLWFYRSHFNPDRAWA